MKLFKHIINSTKLKSFQAENKNEAVLDCMVQNGFSLPGIRKALMDLNEIKLKDLSDGKVSVVTASNTIAGRRVNQDVMAALSEKLRLEVGQLFPE